MYKRQPVLDVEARFYGQNAIEMTLETDPPRRWWEAGLGEGRVGFNEGKIMKVLSRGNRSLRQLEREADAWRFALRHSLVEPTPATARSLLRSLESYLLRAHQRTLRGDRIRAAIPGPDGVYWQVRADLTARAETVNGRPSRPAASATR